MDYQVLESNEGNVWKYVFTIEDNVFNESMVAEAVLYRYDSFLDRIVICCSVQSGCPVGCKFCGTGKNFVRNLTSDEIVKQVEIVLKDKISDDVVSKCKKFQIMLMSMGEPMLNWGNVEKAINKLKFDYPNAMILVSTVGLNDMETFTKIIDAGRSGLIDGLQFSIHQSTDKSRDEIIPYKNKLSLESIQDYGMLWYLNTQIKPYLNYCIDGTNDTDEDFYNLTSIFPKQVFCFTFSVVCDPDKNDGSNRFNDLDEIQRFANRFSKEGYDVRIFNPAGQDDIGGGCGQLWFVQDWMNEHKDK